MRNIYIGIIHSVFHRRVLALVIASIMLFEPLAYAQSQNNRTNVNVGDAVAIETLLKQVRVEITKVGQGIEIKLDAQRMNPNLPFGDRFAAVLGALVRASKTFESTLPANFNIEAVTFHVVLDPRVELPTLLLSQMFGALIPSAMAQQAYAERSYHGVTITIKPKDTKWNRFWSGFDQAAQNWFKGDWEAMKPTIQAAGLGVIMSFVSVPVVLWVGLVALVGYTKIEEWKGLQSAGRYDQLGANIFWTMHDIVISGGAAAFLERIGLGFLVRMLLSPAKSTAGGIPEHPKPPGHSNIPSSKVGNAPKVDNPISANYRPSSSRPSNSQPSRIPSGNGGAGGKGQTATASKPKVVNSHQTFSQPSVNPAKITNALPPANALDQALTIAGAAMTTSSEAFDIDFGKMESLTPSWFYGLSPRIVKVGKQTFRLISNDHPYRLAEKESDFARLLTINLQLGTLPGYLRALPGKWVELKEHMVYVQKMEGVEPVEEVDHRPITSYLPAEVSELDAQVGRKHPRDYQDARPSSQTHPKIIYVLFEGSGVVTDSQGNIPIVSQGSATQEQEKNIARAPEPRKRMMRLAKKISDQAATQADLHPAVDTAYGQRKHHASEKLHVWTKHAEKMDFYRSILATTLHPLSDEIERSLQELFKIVEEYEESFEGVLNKEDAMNFKVLLVATQENRKISSELLEKIKKLAWKCREESGFASRNNLACSIAIAVNEHFAKLRVQEEMENVDRENSQGWKEFGLTLFSDSMGDLSKMDDELDYDRQMYFLHMIGKSTMDNQELMEFLTKKLSELEQGTDDWFYFSRLLRLLKNPYDLEALFHVHDGHLFAFLDLGDDNVLGSYLGFLKDEVWSNEVLRLRLSALFWLIEMNYPDINEQFLSALNVWSMTPKAKEVFSKFPEDFSGRYGEARKLFDALHRDYLSKINSLKQQHPHLGQGFDQLAKWFEESAQALLKRRLKRDNNLNSGNN